MLFRSRAEVEGPNGQQVMIFDGTKEVLWAINTERKTYTEMTKADVDQMAGQMNAAMAQMQAQMAQMLPAQREQMERMMAGRMGAMMAAAPKTEYRKTGSGKVGSWTCDTYEGYRNNQKAVELCTVAPAALGFTAGDFEVAEKMADFFSKLVPQGAENLFRPGKAETQGFSGVPVRRVSFAPPSTSEVTQVTRQNFPESLFTVPDGFTKEAMGMGRGRGRGRGPQ